MKFRTNIKRAALAATIALFSGSVISAATFTWDGEVSNEIFTAGNWNPDGVPGLAVGDFLVFPETAGLTGVQSVSPTVTTPGAYFGNLTFNANAPTYTFSGGGVSYELYRPGADVINNNSSNYQIINNIGTGLLLTGVVNASAGDIVINGAVAVGSGSSSGSNYVQLAGSHNIYFNVDSSIHSAGNIAGGTWTSSQTGAMHNSTRGRFFMDTFSGTAYLGDIGTSYQGAIHINSDADGVLRLTHNNSLGANVTGGSGSTPRQSSVIIYGGTTRNGTLELSGNISVARPVLYVDGRSGAVANDPHIRNVSGNNTFTVGLDWNTLTPSSAGSGNNAGNINVFSDGGKLTLAGGMIYNTSALTKTLVLGGPADGEISATIAKLNSFPTLAIEKTGAGTWTLSNANNANSGGSTPYDGNVTVQAGTLALTGAGSLANSPSIDIKSGAFWDVSGVTGGVYNLNSSNTSIKGAGTITGSIAAASGNTFAPGDSGTGTLHISNGLSLNSAAINFELTSNPGGTNDKIEIGGNLDLAGLTSINVTPLSGALGSGVYTLMSYGGSLSGSALGNLSLSGTPVSARQSFDLDTSTANQVNLLVVGDVANLTWVGGVNGNIWVDGLIENNSVNWTGHGSDNHFYNGDNVTFGSTGTNTVNISGTVAPASVSFINGSGQDYTISGGNVNSAANMTFSGAGNVQMNNSVTSAVNMTFSGTGNVNLNNGQTTASSMNYSGSGAVNLSSSDTTVSGAFTSTGSGDLTILGGNFTAGSFTQNGTGAVIFANTSSSLTLPSTLNINSGVVAFNRGDNFTLTNVLSGAGTFRKDNSNTITLNGNNTPFTGTTLLTGGTLKIAAPNALTNTTVQNGATLYFDTGTAGAASFGSSTKVVSIVGTGTSGAGAIVASPTTGNVEINAHIGNLVLTGNSKITAGNNGGTGRSIIWIEGPITGNGNNLDFVVETVGVGKNTGNEIDLLNAGATNLNNISVSGGGVVYIGQNTDLGSTGVVTLGDGVTSGRIGIYTPQSGSNGLIANTFSKAMSVPAGAVGGVEVYYNADMSISSPISVDAGGRFDALLYTRSNNTTSKVTLTGNITGSGGFGAHLDANGTTSRLGLVELTSNNNTYSGGTTIGGGGGITNLATPANDRITLSIGNGGTTGSIGSGDISVMDWGTLLINRSDNYSLNNRVTGTGVLLNKAGVTTITNTSNDYSGGTIILGGTLKPAAANVLGSGILMFGDTVTADTGTFDNNGFNLSFPQLVSQSATTTANHLLIGAGTTVSFTASSAPANVVVVGGLTVGDGSRLNVSGAGTMDVNDPTKNIAVASRNTAATTQTTLDLSGLANFNASVANIYVGRPTLSGGGASTGAVSDTLALAGSNNVTVAGRIAVGGTNTTEGTGTIRLGQSNTISADQWVVGSARVSGTVDFNTGLINPTATLYGATGVGSRTNILLGDQLNTLGVSNGTGGSTVTLGTMDFTAGTVTAFVESLTVGTSGSVGSNARGRGDGLFKFGGVGSTVDVNTLTIGSAANNGSASTATPQAVTSNGTFEISGGSLVVNTALTIAKDNDTTNTNNGIQDVVGNFNVLGGSVTVGSVGSPVNTVLGDHVNDTITATGNLGTNTANLNITGGTYTSHGDIVQGAFGTNVGTVNLDGGTLNMVGHNLGNATAISNLNLKSGTLSDVGQINNGLSGLTKTSPGTLILSGANTYTSDTTVNEGTLNITGSHTTGTNYSVANGANLITNNVRVTNALIVDGTTTINANGGTAGASKVETLTMGGSGKLNLKDNDLVVGMATNVDAVRTAIIAGKANNAASGITSDLPAFGTTTGFGYAMGNDAAISPLLGGFLTGQSYDADSVLVKYTFLGDADLDGDSDLNDLGLWAQAFTGDLGNPVNPATYWTSGDFDYDGDTDLNDLGFWAGTFTGDLGGGAGSVIVHAPNAPAGAVAALNSMGITVVPEPSTFVLAGVGLAGLAIAARRKRRA